MTCKQRLEEMQRSNELLRAANTKLRRTVELLSKRLTIKYDPKDITRRN